ncbi:hypothetical protein [Nostoc sp. UHCC 0870]|uniref:hypothetical protein n=1 Tax=Nostoc sp. UHCC 0870 TaxID=2914041 RepID=UPI001EDFB522|nr:hypothetical protein [Nostoc sp. UHCC 0870]UKO97707.1 hypothetical protein L6494_24565 [Nostoc sp. UHCC 0870]
MKETKSQVATSSQTVVHSSSRKEMLLRHLKSSYIQPLEDFYLGVLQNIPANIYGDLLIGIGYNFEHYDLMFSKMAFNLQNTFGDTAYSIRYKTMQYLLQPFCSEYGIEANRPLYQTHRELYANFYRELVGQDIPEMYPEESSNPWLQCSIRWAKIMYDALDAEGYSPNEKAIYNVAYHWAVEYLSITEFDLMRQGWQKLNISARYLDAHCAVEDEHGDYAEKAVFEISEPDNPIVVRAIQDHEEHLGGYYKSLTLL